MTHPWPSDPPESPPTRDDDLLPPDRGDGSPAAPPEAGDPAATWDRAPAWAEPDAPVTAEIPTQEGWGAPPPGGYTPLGSWPGPPPGPPSTPSAPNRRWWLVPLAIVVAVLLVGGAFAVGRGTDTPTSDAGSSSANTAVPTATGSTAPPPVSGTADEPVTAVAKALAPAVVQLETTEGLGSGVIYDPKGYILTAAHVVNGVSRVQVLLASGSRLQGTVVGSDPATDVAVVRVSTSAKLPTAQLAVGVPVQVGQLAVAIGSPFGLDSTVTSGVVSAVNRSVPTDAGGVVSMIQTDAPINPGNSGGALADRRGRVVGINDSIRTPTGGNVGVGFAIAIDEAYGVAQKLVSGKPIVQAFLGVSLTDATGSQSGALITGVVRGSPADRAGIQSSDVVLDVDGNAVRSAADLAARIRSRAPGDKVRLKIDRDGKQIDVTATLDRSNG